MDYDIVYSSEYIAITKRKDGYYIESFKNGTSIDQFNSLMGKHSEIRITSFMAIRSTLNFAPKPPIKFGEEKNRISVEISGDELKAFVSLCVAEEEFEEDQKHSLLKEILKTLADNGVVFGLNMDNLIKNLCNNKQILAAEGIYPQNGEDSIIQMFKLKEAKPELRDDGNVDHYELNLINRVKAGEWLGERIDATEGIAGKTVKGNVLQAMSGKTYPLFYDKKTVKEVAENGKTVLYSLCNGAVHYDGDRIGISNHLEIAQNVDFKTGNIEFDGYLTVRGAVEDNFSIAANKDIEVLGEYGIGSVKEVVSHEGSVYIKGGIAGKNKAVIKSKKDIYTKFISDATVICEGSLHIGYYCFNSNITAKEVILDSAKGQITGGNINAEIKIVSSIVGSASEKRTSLCVEGFNRTVLRNRLENVIQESENLKKVIAKVKQEISIYSNTLQLTADQTKLYEAIKDKYFDLKSEQKSLEEEKKILANYLRTHGEGEISILKKAYPRTVLELGKMVKELNKEVISTTFYIQDNEIKQI